MATNAPGGNSFASHLVVVDALAKELQLPAEQVAGAYFREVSRLEANARIKTFVSVLAVGAVRSALRPQATTGNERISRLPPGDDGDNTRPVP